MNYTILDTYIPQEIKYFFGDFTLTKISDTTSGSIYVCKLISNNLFQKKDKYIIVLSKKDKVPIKGTQTFYKLDITLIDCKTTNIQDIQTQHFDHLFNLNYISSYVFEKQIQSSDSITFYNTSLNTELIVYKSTLKPDLFFKKHIRLNDIFNTCDFELKIKN